MGEFTRRAIVKLLGGMPALLPAAAAQAPDLLARAAPLVALSGPISPSREGTKPEPGERTWLGRIIGRQLEDLRQQFEEEDSVAWPMRVDGIDPDIAALKSTSRAYKVARMAQRSRERMTLQASIGKALWG